MNIDKNNISAPKQLIGGERRDNGLLQIFFQSTDAPKQYSTGLNGTYNLTLLDLKVVSAAAAGDEYAVQMISDTFHINNGNTNTNFKFIHRNGCPEIPNPIKLRQAEVRNFIDLDFVRLGIVQDDINAQAYNVLLTIEYERL